MKVTVEVLHVPDCPNLAPMLQQLRAVTDLPITTREVTTEAEARAAGMAGSPTLLVNGVDPFTAAGGCECGVSCRLYRDEHGRVVPAPSAAQLREALAAANQPPASVSTKSASADPAAGDQPLPGEVLSS